MAKDQSRAISGGTRKYFSSNYHVAAILLLIHILLFTGTQAEANVAGATNSSPSETYYSPGEVQQGTLLIKQKSGQYRSMELSGTEVDIQISGMIAETRVRQIFNNSEQEWVEGVYVFPLPDESSVHMLKMHLGDRVIKGEIKEKQEAKAIYQEAKKQGKKTTLVEQERPNIFTTSVANIGPGETVSVEIGYQEIVRYSDSQFSIRFPMVVGPRYIPGKPEQALVSTTIEVKPSGWAVNTTQVPDTSRITPPVTDPAKGSSNPVKISIDLSSGIPLEFVRSPYHKISIDEKTAAHYQVSLEQQVWADRDFVLEWQAKKGTAPRAALFSETFAGDQYGLLMLMPPDRDLNNPLLSREIILVLDISGSMAGTSLTQAKNGLSMAIARLTPADRFNIIVFNDSSRVFFPVSLPGEMTNIKHAIELVNKLQAGGGTNIAGALKLALDGQDKHQRVRQIVFLTDGSVGNEANLFAMIQKKLGDARLFTVGIGSAPNSYFMTRAAEFGRGSFTYIGKVTEVQEKMNSLFARLDSQAMTDVKLETGQANIEQYPQQISDLYSGEPLFVAIKLDTMPKELIIRGSFDDQTRQYIIRSEDNRNRAGIARFWARKKIRSLMNAMTQAKDQDSIRKTILETALNHHLVSRYTSLVAVEEKISRPQAEELVGKNVAVNLPKGWKYKAVFGGGAKTATPATMFNIGGILIIGSALMLFSLARRRRQS